ncbi:polyphosphate--glucose phosphotransferase [Corynebacterium neomassiliense]|uniref:polyphosphate--glucose phosphotransferase n=1 Tax=Corynebacterium neomassiliense TaxID=2079482 RepID=UPI00102F5968|nr:ROK family protein [Corynebacterium neomassiliense]
MTSGNTGFGVDIGGSGIKGARVDLDTGEFIGERIKIPTPQPATPDAVADIVADLLDRAGWTGPVGVTVPSVVQDQIARTAANIDPSWIGTDCAALFSGRLAVGGVPREVTVLNDADAAGLAEATYGDPRAGEGAVLLLTFGTGIGSALLVNGTLYPNTELGHLTFAGTGSDPVDAERWASSAVKDREDLSYRRWAGRVDRVLEEYRRILNPQRILVGGGVSRKFEKWGPHLTVDVEVIPAALRNRAGIVGAAGAVRDGIRP